MVNINDPKDMANLREVYDTLTEVLNGPDTYEIINFEGEKGTSRTNVPGAEDDQHAVQRLGISIMFVEKHE